MQKRKPSKRSNNVYELTEALLANGRASDEGPKRKSWSAHDLRKVKAMTPNQSIMFDYYRDGFNVIGHGSAGTGKTYCALYLALEDMLSESSTIENITIIRSAVQGRDIGFLPGTEQEKMAVYELPYVDIVAQLLGKPNSYQDMKDAGKMTFTSTSFIRGLTWDNTVVIIDEAQNMTLHELDSIVTRVGKNTKLLVCGDTKYQQDLKKDSSGLTSLIYIMNKMNQCQVVEFNHDDIVRSKFVREWIVAREKSGL